MTPSAYVCFISVDKTCMSCGSTNERRVAHFKEGVAYPFQLVLIPSLSVSFCFSVHFLMAWTEANCPPWGLLEMFITSLQERSNGEKLEMPNTIIMIVTINLGMVKFIFPRLTSYLFNSLKMGPR